MKDIEQFVETSVKIEFQEQNGQYGYHPFYMFVEKEDGKNDVICMMNVPSVGNCYDLILKYIREKAKRIYMAVDFPPTEDMKNDFVGVYKWENREFNLFAIPYDTKAGTIYDRIDKNKCLNIILSELIMTTLKKM